MKAIIEVEVPDYQIGQEVNIYFNDTMMIKGIVQEPSGDLISRQAVNEIINDIRDCISVEGYWAILERLKKLPSVNPQEPCEDAVSRQTAINIVKDMHGLASSDVLSEAVKQLKDLPPVTEEPKTGHWIRQDNTKEPLYGWYFCSECNSVIGDKTEFCSNCGAKMIEPQESEDLPMEGED